MRVVKLSILLPLCIFFMLSNSCFAEQKCEELEAENEQLKLRLKEIEHELSDIDKIIS